MSEVKDSSFLVEKLKQRSLKTSQTKLDLYSLTQTGHYVVNAYQEIGPKNHSQMERKRRLISSLFRDCS